MRTYRIAVVPGDGIGKEVIAAGVAVEAVADQEHHRVLSEHPSRPAHVELREARADARSARPVLHRPGGGGESDTGTGRSRHQHRLALEQAVALRGGTGTVAVVSMAPREAEEQLAEALAMGCDRAYLLSDAAFAGADSLATARCIGACALAPALAVDDDVYGKLSAERVPQFHARELKKYV